MDSNINDSTSSPQPEAKSRKSKASRHRDAEKFRLKKNQQFDRAMVEKHSNLRELPTAVSTLFADLSFTPTVRPAIPTLISLTVLPTLMKLVCGFLNESCKVVLDQQDILVLTQVTLLQIKARLYKCRSGSPFPPDLSEDSLVSRVVRTFNQNVFPISHYIGCIGLVKVENQANIPLMNVDEDCSMSTLRELGYHITVNMNRIVVLGEGNPLFGMPVWVEFVDDRAVSYAQQLGILRNDGMVFTTQFLENPVNYNLAGMVRVSPPRSLIPSIEDIIVRYHSILAKVQRRVPQCLETIDFTSDGHPCILVGTRITGQMVEVWSDRFLSDDALVLGSVLRFGEDENGPPERVAVSSTAETAGTLERYARVVVERAQVN